MYKHLYPLDSVNLDAAKKRGINWLLDKDYDHTKKRFVKVSQNRGNYGKGTKPKKK